MRVLLAQAGTQNSLDTLDNTLQGSSYSTGADSPSLYRYLNVALHTVYYLLGMLVVGMFVYAGWLWMTSQGSPDKIKTAKGIMRTAVIGLLVIFLAFPVVNFISNNVLNSPAPTTTPAPQ